MQEKILLQTAAPNYAKSCSFYQTLGFTKLVESDKFSVVGDGQMTLIINGHTGARPGFVCYSANHLKLKQKLSSVAKLHDLEEGFVTADPNGVRLYVKSRAHMATFDSEQLGENNMCGANHGCGIETHYFEETIRFWSLVGYSLAQGVQETTQYAALSHEDGMAITLFKPGNCPHAFYNPSLTYFNGKSGNPQVISNLRAADVTIVEEITIFNDAGEVDNIIITDPGGLHSFIYNDG